jgi:hypothetical protein
VSQPKLKPFLIYVRNPLSGDLLLSVTVEAKQQVWVEGGRQIWVETGRERVRCGTRRVRTLRMDPASDATDGIGDASFPLVGCASHRSIKLKE